MARNGKVKKYEEQSLKRNHCRSIIQIKATKFRVDAGQAENYG
jgi:hypothetical protein